MPLSMARNRTYGCVDHCPSYAFDASDAPSARESERVSVAVEWQLVCEREALLKLATELYYGALLVGAVVAGLLADRIGRMPVMAACLYAQGAIAVALNFVQVRHHEACIAFSQIFVCYDKG